MKEFPPLAELKWLIEYDISEALERLKQPIPFTEEFLNDSEIQSKLQKELEPRIKLQTEKDLNSIEQIYIQLSSINEFQEYASVLQEKLAEIKELENYKNHSFLDQYINKIEIRINKLSGKLVDLKTSISQPSSSNISFNLIVPEDCKKDIQNIELAKILYNSLFENQIIEGEESDFVNGFTKSNVGNRIKWILMIKNNKHTSKISIFYLIRLLIDEGLLAKKKDYRNHIKYVFCDFKGKELEDLRISNILDEDFSTTHDKDKVDTTFQDFLSKLN